MKNEVLKLTQLVREQKLGSVLSSLWASRYNDEPNPVVEAFLYETYHTRMFTVIITGLLFMIISVGFCAVSLAGNNALAVLVSGLAAIVGAITSFACLVVLTGEVTKSTLSNPTNFYQDITLLAEWSTETVLVFGEEGLKSAATQILRVAAGEVLDLQNQGELDQYFLARKKELLEHFGTKFDTLKRLSLIDFGGWEGYFDLAKAEREPPKQAA